MNVPKLDVVYLDTGLYASEGFTSGLLIFMRNMLVKFSEKNLKVGIISLVDEKSCKIRAEVPGLRKRQDSGIDVFEFIMRSDEAQDGTFAERAALNLLSSSAPHTIIMNTPAVFLHDFDVSIRQLANQKSFKVIHVLADELFPTAETHDPALVQNLFNELRKGEVIGVTARIRSEFEKASGIIATPFKTVIRPQDIAFDQNSYNPQYIGMVNIHPLKGISIFNRVAQKMPEHEFLVIKNWPDVPDYHPSSSNVTVEEFSSSPRDFYRKLKILLIPSLMQEGPTMVSMEAFYNGIPVIANHIGSIPEVGENAINFVDPPIIKGNRKEGTILYPICDESEIERASEDYRTAITKVLSMAGDEYRESLTKIARLDIEKGHAVMDSLIHRWSSAINLTLGY